MASVPAPPAGPSVAAILAEFSAGLRFEQLPAAVLERGKLLILDCIGVALASGTYDFAKRATLAVQRLSGHEHGSATVIGQRRQLPPRDAACLNGLLVHGLDYDDSHPAGAIHASASSFPTALAVAETLDLSGRELLLGYLVGVEISTRLSMVARGAFQDAGFHPTGLVGAFGAAVLAARLHGLSAAAIARAQGFAGSLAPTSSMEFMTGATWTKRVHPGWAGACGMTAAAFAAEGYESPERVYEGRFGLYASHLGANADMDLAPITHGLGERWESLDVAVKLYPACHLAHPFADAVLALRQRHDLHSDDVDRIHCQVPAEAVATICEPEDAKRTPRSSFAAQFSLPYLVAASLARGRFGLGEIDAHALIDPEILGLAQRVSYEPLYDSGFPEVVSGDVAIVTRDQRTLRHRAEVMGGTESEAAIREKFRDNAGLALDPLRSEQIAEAALALEHCERVREFTTLLRTG